MGKSPNLAGIEVNSEVPFKADCQSALNCADELLKQIKERGSFIL